MDGRITLCPNSFAGPKRPANSVRPSAKAGFAADPHGKQNGNAEPRMGRQQPLILALVCQGSTPIPDPVWDAPRIMPAFAAQLLGQVMASGAPAASGNGYMRTAAPAPCRIDLRR